MLHGWEDKSGYALCTFAFHSGNTNDDVKLFRGKCEVTDIFTRILFNCS